MIKTIIILNSSYIKRIRGILTLYKNIPGADPTSCQWHYRESGLLHSAVIFQEDATSRWFTRTTPPAWVFLLLRVYPRIDNRNRAPSGLHRHRRHPSFAVAVTATGRLTCSRETSKPSASDSKRTPKKNSTRVGPTRLRSVFKLKHCDGRIASRARSNRSICGPRPTYVHKSPNQGFCTGACTPNPSHPSVPLPLCFLCLRCLFDE